MIADISKAISKDTKSIKIGSEWFKIAQVELWDANTIANNALVKTAKKAIDVKDREHWLLNIANISQGSNILVTDNEKTRSLLYDIGYPCPERIWLRK